MQPFGKILSLTAFIALVCCTHAFAQIPDSTTSVDTDLENIFKQTQPKEYRVGTVTVTGNRYFDQALLLSIANINKGERVMIPGGDNFSKVINNLWGQNYFSNVAIYITKLTPPNIIDLEITVEERPRLGSFVFVNTGKSQSDELTTKTGLVKQRVITESMKQNAIEAIKKFYDEKGYRNTNVKIVESQSTRTANSRDFAIYITKGNKVKIENINPTGNIAITDKTFVKQFKDTKMKGRFSSTPVYDSSVYSPKTVYTFKHYVQDMGFMYPSKTKAFLDPYLRIKPFVNAKFNQKKYEDDKDKLLAYYNSIGYRDARIVDDTTYYNRNGNLNIDIKVDEGHQYFFGNIVFKGNTKYPDSVLQQILRIKKGDVYNLELLNKRVGKEMSQEGGDISGYYMDDGYLFFHTEITETAVYNDTIDHEIKLVEGPQATIKNVNIVGNEKTKEHVIRRELRTNPGDKFSRQLLIRTQRELANLSFFNQEKIAPNIVPNQDDGTVDITWSVEEKSSDQLELSAGWGGGIGLTGTLGVTFNNFSIHNIFKKSAWQPLPSGDGQKLSLRVQSNGRAFQSYNASFTEPWLGGKHKNPFTVSLYTTKYANAYDATTGTYTSAAANNSYIRTSGVGVSLGKQLKWPDDFFSLLYSVNLTEYQLKNYAIFSGFNNGTSTNLSFKLGLQRNSIDQPTFPRSGSNFALSVQFTPPWSLVRKNLNYDDPSELYKLVELHKWRFTGDWYLPLSKITGAESHPFVLRLAAKMGFNGRYNNKLQVSPFERYQLGDAGLSNNFALLGYDIISQRGYPVYQTSDPKVNPDQSGASKFFTIFNKYTAELRYPISTNPSSTIYAMVWAEAANGWYSMSEYNPFQLRRSVGLGMRFFLPMFGLLGFDYGVGIDRLQPGQGIKNAAKFTFMLGYEPE